ncbi:hypothetical protein [Anoxybacteroides tepidamans]|uniref:hypothetical protein n=1 Tax=Anoxybacteroides tepidamans TaxID=265948 RepID=UPI000483B765|nr:hypothetical protein [Anoxybacillus tepidamans]
MSMYYLGLFLWTHLAAGILAAIIEYFFYRDILHEAIEEFNQEYNLGFEVTLPMYFVARILGGWYTLFTNLKSIFDYYFEPDDDNDEDD